MKVTLIEAGQDVQSVFNVTTYLEDHLYLPFTMSVMAGQQSVRISSPGYAFRIVIANASN